MTNQRIVKLKQMGESYDQFRKLLDAEEGDDFDGFKVIDVVETDCTHEERRWKVRPQRSEEPPEAEGKCLLCGDTRVIDLKDVDDA